MKQRLAILLWATSPETPHRCATPFFHAATAAAMDVEVEIYFTSASVRLLASGVAEALHSGPRERETVYGFMRHAAGHGVKFYGCSQAMAEYGVAAPELIPEYSGAAGAAAYIARSLDPEWATLQY